MQITIPHVDGGDPDGVDTVTWSLDGKAQGDCPKSCSATAVPAGTPATFVAKAAAGSHFAMWGGDCRGSKPTCSVTVGTGLFGTGV